jgi:hypothetical protein
MKAEIKGKDLVITIPISEKDSKSGKTTVIASSGGNIGVPGLMHKGKQIFVGVNAYVKKD